MLTYARRPIIIFIIDHFFFYFFQFYYSIIRPTKEVICRVILYSYYLCLLQTFGNSLIEAHSIEYLNIMWGGYYY